MRRMPSGWLSGWNSLWSRYKYALVVVLVGVLLLLLPEGKENPDGEAPPAQQPTLCAQELEHTLERILSRIEGAGQVSVALTVKEGPRQVLARDMEQRQEETVQEYVLISQGSGRQNTVALQTVAPIYQGALVVCDGGEDPVVRLRLLEGVRVLTGLSSDKISVSKRG